MYTKKVINKLLEKHPNLNEEQVVLILNSFYDGFRYYCTNPLECRSKILINGLLSITIPTKKIKKYILAIKLKENILTEEEFEQYKQKTKSKDIEIYEQLLKINSKYERQKKKQIYNERSVS